MKTSDSFEKKSIIYNLGYFLQEVKAMVRMNMSSYFLSLISTGLIFFILSLVISGWWVTNKVVEVIEGEAEINAYFNENMDNTDVLLLLDKIKSIEGVNDSFLVSEKEAYDRMVEILGREARVLEAFDENPFSSFIEVKIDLDKIDVVTEKLVGIDNIEHIRDNREVLSSLHNISGVLSILGYLVIAAVGITTTVIISHIIRTEIHNNRDQIITLRLLGAPEGFIFFPFLLEGLLLTLLGGILAVILSSLSLKYIYAQLTSTLSFIPLPAENSLIGGIIILIIELSIALGAIGSVFGLSSAKEK